MLFVMLSLSQPCISWRADIIELNHVVDCSGHESLCQTIWWAWRPADDYRVLAWRLTSACGEPIRTDEGWIVRWREKGVRYETTARVLTETWTLHDREIADRAWLESARRLEWRLGR